VIHSSLGIKRLLGLHYYVRDLERSRDFYVQKLGFHEFGRSSPELEQCGHQRSIVFQSGDIVVTCSTPMGEGGRAFRYLSKHPDGVGTVAFEVENIRHTFELLEQRGGTAITDVQSFHEPDGDIETFSITTPFGDTTFRFIERRAPSPLFPGFIAAPAAAGDAAHAVPGDAGNRFGFTQIDHLTSNFQTMKPALLWMEHVLGFEQIWEIAFHTNDVAAAQKRDHGSGLKSVVMGDPQSGIKFANNEPFRPYFKESQINIFAEDNRGDGVQHSALAVTDILQAVRGLRARGVEFMSTPGSYFDMLPERLRTTGIGAVDESLDDLRELQILVDGEKPRQYLLQIFLKEAAGLHHDPEAGPFFFEIIQRKGDKGFGAGNFRALFEAIERDQQSHRAPGVAAPSPPRM